MRDYQFQKQYQGLKKQLSDCVLKPNKASSANPFLNILAHAPKALLTQKPQHISTVLKAAQVVTSLWLFDHCCQHTEMREGGYNPGAGLKFTLYRQSEDGHVTTPPNDLSQKKEIKKDRKMGGDRVQGGRSGRCKSWPPFSGLTILMWTPPRPLLNCAKLIWRSRHIFYANATVLSTQGACREAGGGLMGLDALQGGEMRMGWDG